MKEIIELLAKRDKAVAKGDLTLFLSTQVSEISGSSSDGYLSTDKLESTLVAAHENEVDPNHIVGIVEEKYWNHNQYSHKGYLLYHFRKHGSGDTLVEAIAWCPLGSSRKCA